MDLKRKFIWFLIKVKVKVISILDKNNMFVWYERNF